MTEDPFAASARLADQLAAMAERMAQLERLTASQQAEIERLRATPAPLPPDLPAPPALAMEAAPVADPAPSTREHTSGGTRSRRALLKLGGAAAAAGVAAMAAGTSELAHPGTAQAHSDTATITYTASGGGNVAIEGDGTSGAYGITGTSDLGYGVVATSNSGTGLYSSSGGVSVLALSSGNSAVVGNSNTNYGGVFSGGLAPLRLGPGAGAGAPSSGAHNTGELYVDTTGVLWFCTGIGSPGTWVRLAGVAATAATGLTFLQSAAGGANVAIEGDGTSGAFGVIGTSDSSTGVVGTSTNWTGVVGNSTNQVGVHGTSTNYVGVQGTGTSATGVGGWFVGGRAALALGAGAAPGAPTTGQHYDGDIYLDSKFTIWVCVGNGTPGTWVRLISVANGTPGGALNYLPAPIRIFDSRGGAAAPLPAMKGALMGGSTTTIQVSGTDVGGIHIPTGATGVFGNLTVTNTAGPGDLILWPHGAPQPTVSNINYGPGQTVANSFNVGLNSAGQMDLFVHVSGTDVILDIAGYVL